MLFEVGSRARHGRSPATLVTAADSPATGSRLDILPGSATPAVLAAREPFWIGYALAPSGPETDLEASISHGRGTKFELDVDGEPVRLDVTETREGDRLVSRSAQASFQAGLSPGWHRFSGRWYVAGRIVLTSDVAIEFVEP